MVTWGSFNYNLVIKAARYISGKFSQVFFGILTFNFCSRELRGSSGFRGRAKEAAKLASSCRFHRSNLNVPERKARNDGGKCHARDMCVTRGHERLSALVAERRQSPELVGFTANTFTANAPKTIPLPFFIQCAVRLIHDQRHLSNCPIFTHCYNHDPSPLKWQLQESKPSPSWHQATRDRSHIFHSPPFKMTEHLCSSQVVKMAIQCYENGRVIGLALSLDTRVLFGAASFHQTLLEPHLGAQILRRTYSHR